MSLTPRVDCIIIRKVSMKRGSGEEEEEEVGYSWEIGGGTRHELLGSDVESWIFFLLLFKKCLNRQLCPLLFLSTCDCSLLPGLWGSVHLTRGVVCVHPGVSAPRRAKGAHRWASKVPSPLPGELQPPWVQWGDGTVWGWRALEPERPRVGTRVSRVLMFPDASLRLSVSTSEIIIPAFKQRLWDQQGDYQRVWLICLQESLLSI